MSKAQAIRDALKDGALSFDELISKVGGTKKQLKAMVGYLVQQRQVQTTGRGDKQSISLRSDGKPAPAAKRRVKRRKNVATTFQALENSVVLDESDALFASAFRAHKEAIDLLTA